MATDFDAPRTNENDHLDDNLRTLKATRTTTKASRIDALDHIEADDVLPVHYAGLPDEDLSVPVLPKQQDEFACTICHLVHHRSRLARTESEQQICRDCA
ncbi:DUF4193 family protein [Kitasatospora sp. NPDC048540]|uniref:DUF4193 family protein n=1 Tax=unclassified Kitasatospora TaxID=2633591 RepID=UPI00053A90B5|nr:DUF4193 family protein [Kitasatospora sp. MBT63]